jgi:aminopeptidase N
MHLVCRETLTKGMRWGMALLLALGMVTMSGAWSTASTTDDDDVHSHGDSSYRRRFARKGTKPKYARSTPFLIKHVHLRLTILPRKRFVKGTATLTIKPSSRNIKRITLDAAELRISRITVDGKVAKWNAEGYKLHITLPSTLTVGNVAAVAVTYEANPRSGLHFVLPDKDYPNKPVMVFSQGESEYNRFWFPSFDTPNMRFTSETVITVPAPLQVIANGKLLKQTTTGKMITYHHKMPFSHVNYLTSLAIGEFALYKQTWKKTPILSYVPKAAKALAKRSFENTADMMDFFSKKIGFAYPYSKYAQVVVHDFVSGGMENITATTLNHRTLHDARAHLTRRSDGLVAHELAHQWFGDLLTCKDWSHIWLNESFATYFTHLYFEHKWGQTEFNYTRMRSMRWYTYTPYKRAIQERVYEFPSDVFDAHAYPKGAAVLHMIRRKLGDVLWWKAISHYVKKHAHGLVETADFRRALEHVSGQNWEPFFDQWIRRPGHPVLKLSWKYVAKHKQIRVTIRQKQKQKPFSFGTTLRVTVGKKVKTIPVHVKGRRQSLVFSVTGRPQMIELDPFGDILMKYSAKKSPQQWLYQLTHGASVVSRLRAASQLGKYPNRPKVLAAIKALLNTEKAHFSVRAAVAGALGKMQTPAACKLLMNDGFDAKEARVRQAVAAQLGNCRDSNPLEELVTMFRTDKSYAVQAAALTSIGKLRHPKSFGLLVEGLGYTGDYGRIQSAALAAMARLETPKAIPYLRKFSKRGPSTRVRLGAMTLFASTVKLFRKRKKADDVLLLVSFLKDPHPWVRGTALRAMSILGDWRALPHMRRFAETAALATTKRRVRRAIRALYKQTKKDRRWKRLGGDLEKLRKSHRKLLKRLKRLEARRNKKK